MQTQQQFTPDSIYEASAAKVWLPVVATGKIASVAALQRMSPLLASTESTEKKLQTAAKIADSTSTLLTSSKSSRQSKMTLAC